MDLALEEDDLDSTTFSSAGERLVVTWAPRFFVCSDRKWSWTTLAVKILM